MPRFPVYGNARSSVLSFERHDLDWVLHGTVVAPEGAVLFPGARSGRLLLSLPPSSRPGEGLPSYLWPGEAAREAMAGGYGLSWEPAGEPADHEAEGVAP